MHDNTTATQLYHIAQEAVSNAARHGKARSVRINLYTGERGRLAISDDGRWPMDTQLGEHGMGMRIMAHRAAIIGGRLDIDRGKNRGTIISCDFENRATGGRPDVG